MAWSSAEVLLLAKRMEGRGRGFSVSATTAPLVVTALRHYAREGMGEPVGGYRIDVWSTGQTNVVRELALVQNLVVAHAAYEAAVRELAPQPVTLRRGARVIRDSDQEKEDAAAKPAPP